MIHPRDLWLTLYVYIDWFPVTDDAGAVVAMLPPTWGPAEGEPAHAHHPDAYHPDPRVRTAHYQTVSRETGKKVFACGKTSDPRLLRIEAGTPKKCSACVEKTSAAAKEHEAAKEKMIADGEKRKAARRGNR